LIACFPQSVNAEEDLIIPEWVVDAQLLENGDLQIAEDISFEFNDYFNGVFREIVLNKTSGVSDIRVQELIGTALKKYTRVEEAKKGDSDVYLIKDETDKITIQIFSPLEDEVKTFRISYVVKNVNVPSDTFVEGRILFPKEFIPLASNVQNIDNLSNILEEETAYPK